MIFSILFRRQTAICALLSLLLGLATLARAGEVKYGYPAPVNSAWWPNWPDGFEPSAAVD